MAYSENVKQRAYTLFLVGKNAEQIEGLLKPEFPKISANTIRKWSETPDALGKTWFDYREEVNYVTKLQLQEKATNFRSKIKSDNAMMLRAVRNAFLDEAGKMIGQAKDPVSLGYLWKALATNQLQLENEDSGSIDLIRAADTLLDLFMKGPKTKKAISDEWAIHQKNLLAWHSEWTNAKEVQGTIIEEPIALPEKSS
ncbi:hypothetical protein LEP1GSC020_3185 [Leptospira interrogans serovar Grippotyphosa str. 2006006986]|uniref:hypothetical protein n=1 Tax=Leptospira interrogans TaxID=173 RepID=UPI0002926F1D|nr:hypothetical protein [Leptospira interrogans]EKO89189.1 hypothetical protein LEP1GSC009_4148 [Leptospira interrogans serovar Grippotyphosa str. Andaman]EKP83433.1 hypothetical protein LEP1GSC020_3185 [Leptospira interrogans serovar Grippotyphosa str. 2006006986]KGE28366.1 hypothetical protein IQ65_01070 [Leptospira interrogans serovar Lai]UML85835.1 hypothetical protein FH587_10390 [Leptospira interrogans]